MKTKFGIRPEKRTGSECSVFCSATFFAISRLVRRNRAQRKKGRREEGGRDGLNISKAATREGGGRRLSYNGSSYNVPTRNSYNQDIHTSDIATTDICTTCKTGNNYIGNFTRHMYNFSNRK